MRAVHIARIGWGSALLFCPETILRLTDLAPISRRWRATARFLGARHLMQACIAGGHHKYRFAIVASVDAVHAATAFGFAACSRRFRRLAWIDGAIATVFAISVAAARDRRLSSS